MNITRIVARWQFLLILCLCEVARLAVQPLKYWPSSGITLTHLHTLYKTGGIERRDHDQTQSEKKKPGSQSCILLYINKILWNLISCI